MVINTVTEIECILNRKVVLIESILMRELTVNEITKIKGCINSGMRNPYDVIGALWLKNKYGH